LRHGVIEYAGLQAHCGQLTRYLVQLVMTHKEDMPCCHEHARLNGDPAARELRLSNLASYNGMGRIYERQAIATAEFDRQIGKRERMQVNQVLGTWIYGKPPGS